MSATTRAIKIPSSIYDQILHHAHLELPNECVGLLVGLREGPVQDAYPLVNELQSPRRFLSEPRSMLAAEKRRRAANFDVLAVYHSHPSSPPVPSQRDVADHLAPEILCIIISLEQPEARMRAWQIEHQAFQEVLIEVGA
jgi:proteasome lid subunit RPN8/RPN11